MSTFLLFWCNPSVAVIDDFQDAVGSDFRNNYILKHYPSSSVNQLRAYSCEDLNSMCSWVEYKDAVLDKKCEQIYSKDSLEHAACLKVIEREDIFFGKLRNCEKDNLNKKSVDWLQLALFYSLLPI